jgi:hypothetical protein
MLTLTYRTRPTADDVDDVLDTDQYFPYVIDPHVRSLFGFLTADPRLTRRNGAHVSEDGLLVRFGPWVVRTPLENITDARVVGPFRAWQTLGVRVSLLDRGLTFATNTTLAVRVHFRHPVSGLDPLGLIKHPTLTCTVAEPQVLVRWLRHRTLQQ